MASRSRPADSGIRERLKRYIDGDGASFIRWCRECGFLKGGSEEWGTSVIPFKMWPKQEELGTALCEQKRVIVLKPRQMGASWVAAAFLVYRVCYWYGQEYRVASVGEKEAIKFLDKVKFILAHMPEDLRPTLDVSNTTTVRVEETGSLITALPATENAGIGDTLDGFVLDECARSEYAKQIVSAATPALEKRGGFLFLISTANGMGNYFEKTYHAAERGEGGFKPIFFDAFADPTRDQAWYDKMIKEEGEEFVHEHYPLFPGQAWLASGRPYFSSEKVEADLAAASAEFKDGYLVGREFVPRVKGLLRVWERPNQGKKYVIFSDISEGLEKGDWSVAYVVPVGGGAEVARLRGKVEVGEWADLLMVLGTWYGNKGEDGIEIPALLAVESNNHGIAVTKQLQEAGYRNLFYERDLKTGDIKDRIGWLTTVTTRRLMLGKLQSDYRTGKCVVRDRTCLEEMALFSHRGPGGKAQGPADGFDDCVMARAGANVVATMESEPEATEPWVDGEEAKALGFKHTDAEHWVKKDVERAQRKKDLEGAGAEDWFSMVEDA